MDEGYFSHVPLLAVMVLKTAGPVLELGAGLGSTLMLHGMCCVLNRELTTLESDRTWMLKFVSLARPWHIIREVENFKEVPEYSQNWGLVFVDHGIMEEREDSIKALQYAPIIVVHDTCHPWLYGYEPLLSCFKYRWDWQVNGPRTSVVSNSVNVGQLLGELEL